MNRKFIVAMSAFMLTGIGIYAYLGGFSSPTVTLTTSKPLVLAGQPFNGTVKDDAFGNAFRRAAQLLDSKELDGMLGNVYYNNPESKSDTIKAFIGIVLNDTTATLPNDYKLLRIPGGRKVVHSEVEAHYMVGPGKLYSALFEYADEQNIKLENFYVEWFPTDRKGIVESPVKQ
jgi:DNA gyrase inhibitor GyrI